MYFVYPFGVNGTLTAVPPTAAPAVLSYQYGFGVDFELPLNSNPSALPIPRSQFNQLMNDITTAIQQYQQTGTPAFIMASQNLGVAFPYAQYARVNYGGQIYENQVASNTATPGTDETWLLISGAADGFQPGMIIEYGGQTAPGGWLLCDGTDTYSRTTFSNLFSAITFVQTGTTDGVTAVVTGLSDTSKMYVNEYLEGTGIAPGSMIISINSSTQITLSQPTTAVGTVPLTFFPFGAGSTTSTFAVPRRIDVVAAGAHGTLLAGSGQSGVGLAGGAAAYQQKTSDVASHVHPPLRGTFVENAAGTPTFAVGGGTFVTTDNTTGANLPSGTNTAMPIVQPTMLMNFLIKT